MYTKIATNLLDLTLKSKVSELLILLPSHEYTEFGPFNCLEAHRLHIS